MWHYFWADFEQKVNEGRETGVVVFALCFLIYVISVACFVFYQNGRENNCINILSVICSLIRLR